MNKTKGNHNYSETRNFIDENKTKENSKNLQEHYLVYNYSETRNLIDLIGQMVVKIGKMLVSWDVTRVGGSWYRTFVVSLLPGRA